MDHVVRSHKRDKESKLISAQPGCRHRGGLPPARRPGCRYTPGGICEALERRIVLSPLTSLPLLSSRAGAPVTIHLDFDGTPAFEFDDTNNKWASGPLAGDSDPIPAFSIDGNVNDYTQGELDAIGAIWQHVKEKFSPFDINVTTVAPPNYNDGVAVHAIMAGSNNDWYKSSSGAIGVAPNNAFTNGRPNSAFTFTADIIASNNGGNVTALQNAARLLIAETAAHELGHTFGLRHQSDVDGSNNVTAEYGNGDGNTTPIMGNSGIDANDRDTWYSGPSTFRDANNNIAMNGIQDDLAVLTRPGNFINYRVDDFGSFSGSGSISVNGSTGAATAAGVIERNGDQDAFTFTAIAPTVQFTVNGGDFGGMLAPTLELIPIGAAAAGSITLTTTNTSATLSATGLTPGGGYILRVSPQGNTYGNIGQYSITGNTGAFAALSGGVLTVNGFNTVNDLLISYHPGSDTIVLQDDVFGGSAVMQFPRAQVNEIRVQFGAYFHDDEINVLGQFSGLSIPIHVVAGSVGTDRLVLHGTTGNDVMSLGFFDHLNNNTPIITVGIEQFVLTGFDGADTYNVNAVPENVLVTVNGGGGNDVINVAPAIEAARVRSPVTVNGEGGDDTLNLGGGWLDSVGGLITFNGGPTGSAAGNRVILNDQVGFIPYSYLVGPTSVTRDPHFAGLSYSNTQRLTLHASAGHNTVTVGNGINPIVEVNGGDGNDNFVVGDGLMDSGAGPLLGNFNGGNGTDQITFDDHMRTSGVIWDIRPTQVFYGGIFGLSTNAFEAVGILAGNGNDQIVFDGDIGSKAITVDAGGGNDVIDTNHARAQSLSIAGGAGSDKLEVDDVGMPTGTIFQHYVTPGYVQRYDFIGEYYVFYSAMEQLDVVLPAQQNNVYIGGTSAGFTQILGTTLSDNIIVTPRDGAGNPTIGGQLNIFCGDGSDSFEIDASASNTPSEFLIGSDNLFGFNPGVIMVGGGGILVQNSEAIRVRGGGGDDTFRVSTFPGLGVTPSLELSGNNGADTFHIDSFKTGTPLTINAGAGNDVLHFGNGLLRNNITSIGSFAFNGGADFDSFYVNNTNSTAVDGYYFSPGFVSVLPSGASFLTLGHSSVEFVSAHAGSAGDSFQVYATNPGETIDINGNGGNDFIQFSGIIGSTMQSIRSRVIVNGGGGGTFGNDTISLANYEDTVGRTYHVTQSQLGGLPGDNLFGVGGFLDFFGVTGTLSIYNGSGADTIYAQPNFTTPLFIDGRNPTTAPGDRLFLALSGAGNPVFTPAGAGAGGYTFSDRRPINYVDIETASSDAAAPAITSITFNPSMGGHSIAFAFSEDVSASLSAASLSLTNVATGNIQYAYAGNVATFTFPSLPGGVLPSGSYTATLVGATDPAGNAATGSNTYRFVWSAGTAGADAFRVALTSNGKTLQFFENNATTPAYAASLLDLKMIAVHGGGGADSLVLDLVNGLPIPSIDALRFTGGEGADTLSILGSAAADAVTFDATSTTINGRAVIHDAVETFTFDGAGGGDDLAILTGAVALAGTQRLASLFIDSAATLDVLEHEIVLDYSAMSPIGNWLGSSYDGITGMVASGRIVSSQASAPLTAIAAAEASQALGLSGSATATWSGQVVDATSVLVKLTWAGDATLDGRINIDDYGRIDGNVAQSGSVFGWFNGDFNYDGKINIDDYGIIDSNIAAQGAPLLAADSATVRSSPLLSAAEPKYRGLAAPSVRSSILVINDEEERLWAIDGSVDDSGA